MERSRLEGGLQMKGDVGREEAEGMTGNHG